MSQKPIISSPQLFTMFFLIAMVSVLTSNSLAIGGSSDIQDYILSCGISLIFNFILFIPIYKIYSIDKSKNILDNLFGLLGKFSYFFVLIYVVYFLIASSYIISVFEGFILSVTNLPISILLLCVLIIISACYAATKGIEGLSRASSIILFFIVVSAIAVEYSLFSGADKINYRPFLYEGTKPMWQGAFFMVTHNFCLPALLVAFSLVKGKIGKGFIVWNIAVYSSLALVIFLVVGFMGDFAKIQMYPFYTALSITKLGPFEHVESFYLGFWIMAVFIQVALFLNLISICIKKFFGEFASKCSVWLCGAILIVFFALSKKLQFLYLILDPMFLFLSLILISLLLPVAVIIVKSVEKGMKKVEN